MVMRLQDRARIRLQTARILRPHLPPTVFKQTFTVAFAEVSQNPRLNEVSQARTVLQLRLSELIGVYFDAVEVTELLESEDRKSITISFEVTLEKGADKTAIMSAMEDFKVNEAKRSFMVYLQQVINTRKPAPPAPQTPDAPQTPAKTSEVLVQILHISGVSKSALEYSSSFRSKIERSIGSMLSKMNASPIVVSIREIHDTDGGAEITFEVRVRSDGDLESALSAMRSVHASKSDANAYEDVIVAVAQIAGVLEEDIDVKASAAGDIQESDDDDSNVVMNFEASEVEVGKKETKPEADQKVPAAEPDKVNVAAIAAGVLGGALLIVLAAVAVKLLLIRREKLP